MSGDSGEGKSSAASNTDTINLLLTFTDDPYQRLHFQPNPDGTFTRLVKFPESPAVSDDRNLPVLSKDIPINQSNNTWIRVFLPRHALDPSPTKLLPLVIYYHGGGFVRFSAASTLFHDFCVGFATHVPVIIASVEYRLAPEHRLPAAYDDAMEALHLIETSSDDWLKQHADLSNCFLMGMSAGGNIAYHAALRAAADVDRLRPLKIQGLILQQPFFGGTQRSSSELRLGKEPTFPLSSSDLMWELSLPRGADRDHEYSNPTVAGASKGLDRIKAVGWRVLVTGWDGDLLIDRQIEVTKMLEGKGIKVVGHFGKGGFHGIDVYDAAKANELFVVIKTFIFP